MTAKTFVTAFLAASVLAGAAEAATPKSIATFRDWYVFTMEDAGDMICYAVSEPLDKEPKNVNHGDVFMLVSTWKSGKASNEPSFSAGYQLNDDFTPTIEVGSDSYDLFVAENRAYIDQAEEERRLINAMKRGSSMIVKAKSANNTITTYEISLLGISAALERIEEACE